MYAKRAPAIYTNEHFGKVSRFVLLADEAHLTPLPGPAAAASPGAMKQAGREVRGARHAHAADRHRPFQICRIQTQ